MAQSGFGEAMDSFDEVAEVHLSATGLFLEECDAPAIYVTGCLTGSMTFTVKQQIITQRNICYNKQD
jgi:hypothetical protein